MVLANLGALLAQTDMNRTPTKPDANDAKAMNSAVTALYVNHASATEFQTFSVPHVKNARTDMNRTPTKPDANDAKAMNSARMAIYVNHAPAISLQTFSIPNA